MTKQHTVLGSRLGTRAVGTCYYGRVLRQTHGEAGFRAKAGFVRPMNARLAAGPAGLVTGTAGEKFNRFKR